MSKLLYVFLCVTHATSACPNLSKPQINKIPEIPRKVNYKDVEAVKAPWVFTRNCGFNKYWNTAHKGAGIVGGSLALPNEFPWLVYTDSESKVSCVGSIYGPRSIVTAGHCCPTKENGHGVYVWLGSNTRRASNATALYVANKFVYRHPSFKAVFNATDPQRHTDILNDFCVLVLEDDMDFSKDNIKPICLPQSCRDTCLPGEMVQIAGWGYTLEGEIPRKLITGQIPVIANSECSGAGWYDTAMPDNVMCAGGVPGVTAQTMTCAGDSGSPAMCFKNGYFQMDGVLSASNDRCLLRDDNAPAAFGRVCYPELLDWLRSFL